jgi:adenylosuccinate lyase
MTSIWDTDNRFRIMLEVEILAAERMAAMGTIPARVPADTAQESEIQRRHVSPRSNVK